MGTDRIVGKGSLPMLQDVQIISGEIREIGSTLRKFLDDGYQLAGPATRSQDHIICVTLTKWVQQSPEA